MVSSRLSQSPVGIDQLAVLADRLRPERIAAVHHSPDPGIAAWAVRLAALLGVMPVRTGGLQELGTEAGLGTAIAALEGIADGYRGEAVAVVANPQLIELVLPRLPAKGPVELTGASYDIVELATDADGWRLVRRPERQQ